MADQPDLAALQAELATIRARVDQLTRDGAERPGTTVSRRRMLTGLAGMGAASVASVAAAAPASAANGDAVLLGQTNTATSPTTISSNVGGEQSEVVLGGSGPWGVFATSDSTAVIGVVGSGGLVGVNGEAVDTTGVLGNASGAGGIGVVATSSTGPALAAQSSTDGVTLELTPAARSGPPTALAAGLTEYRIGAVSVDEDGELWLCIATGAPGTWRRLLREDTSSGRMVPIAPIRTIDTRAPGGRPAGSPAIPGQKAGPLKGGTSVTLDLAGIDAIPATATGVVGNLTVAGPSYTGYLVARPSGAASTTSSLNFPKGVTAIANAFTSQLGPAGLTIAGSGSGTTTNPNTYHLIVDITAYIS